MNLQAYISSGILELYAAGLASPEEIREVEAMAEQHPEVRKELDAIQQTLEAYIGLHGVQPPAGLMGNIMERLDAPLKGRQKGKDSNESASQSNRSYEPRDSSEKSMASIATWILGLALLGACVAVFLFWRQADRAGAQMKAAQEQVEQVKKDCEAEKAKANEVKEQFIAIRHWATKPVQMKATPLGGDAFAVVYWNNIKKTAYLDVVKLPPPAADKQYQLWAIVGGKPTDMGVFDIGSPADSLRKVEFIERPEAFAVTLEPKGGSQSPTLDQMWVVGSVKG
ncbi:MAG: anti-sigma factor [Saprospiraceae bacterium]|nr:anti-sigma factor [Saprospiraceae bacterium]